MAKISFPRVVLIAFLCAYMIALPGCNGKNPSTPDDTPPNIPAPSQTMQLDRDVLDLFTPGGLGKSSQILPKQNWLTAAFIVWAFNIAVLVGLSIPALATAAALSVEPTLETDGKWHWVYSYPATNPTLELELTGQVKPQVIEWEMFVTRQLPTPLTDFLWYRGESKINGESGFWLFFNDRKPAESAEIVQIDWQVKADLDRTLQFSDKNVDSDGFGNTLTYSIKDSIATVLFAEAASSDTTKISWNTETQAGYIITPDYNNGAQACWDENLDNTDCSN